MYKENLKMQNCILEEHKKEQKHPNNKLPESQSKVWCQFLYSALEHGSYCPGPRHWKTALHLTLR